MFLWKREMFPRKRAAAAAWAHIIDRNLEGWQAG
jgi:hypothetical protein